MAVITREHRCRLNRREIGHCAALSGSWCRHTRAARVGRAAPAPAARRVRPAGRARAAAARRAWGCSAGTARAWAARSGARPGTADVSHVWQPKRPSARRMPVPDAQTACGAAHFHFCRLRLQAGRHCVPLTWDGVGRWPQGAAAACKLTSGPQCSQCTNVMHAPPRTAVASADAGRPAARPRARPRRVSSARAPASSAASAAQKPSGAAGGGASAAPAACASCGRRALQRARRAARRTHAARASAPLPAHGGHRAARGGPRHAGLPLGAGAHQPRRAPGDEAQAPVDGRVLGRPRALGRAAGRGAACGARRTRHARSRLWRSSVRSQGLRGSEPGPLVCQARSTGSLPSRTPPAHEERTRHITNSLLVCLSELHAAAQAHAPGGQRGARPPPCCHSQAAPSAPGAAASARLPRPAADPVAGAAVTRRRPAHRLARLPGLPRRRPPAAALLRL